MSSSYRYDAVIIGSGHNGLVAAAYLAKAGRSVLVLEKSATFGGATASEKIFPDYDAWLSRYSYLISLFPEKITRDLGLKFETKRRATASFTPWTTSSGEQRGLILSNVDEQRSRDSLFEMTGQHSSWNRYQEFIALQSAIAEIVWPTMLKPLPSKADFQQQLKTDQQREAWKRFVEEPLGKSIEHYADHDALRGLLMTDGKIGVFTHAHDESLLQNRCFLYHIIGQGTGEWRVPVGGMKSLVKSLLKVCDDEGVLFCNNAEALNIETSAKRQTVTFRQFNTEVSVEATDIFINAGPATQAALLGEPWQPTSEDEGSVIKMNLLLKRLPRLKASNTTSAEAFCGSFHIDEGYQQMQHSWSAAKDGSIPNPAPGEVYCHTLTDSSILSDELAAEGYQTLTLFGLDMPWRLFESNHDARRAQVAKLYLEGLNRLCEEPIEDCLALDSSGQPCIEIKTPQDLKREVDLDLGNIFHSSLSWFWADEKDAESWGVETSHPHIHRAGSSAVRGGAVSGIPGHNAATRVLQPKTARQ